MTTSAENLPTLPWVFVDSRGSCCWDKSKILKVPSIVSVIWSYISRPPITSLPPRAMVSSSDTTGPDPFQASRRKVPRIPSETRSPIHLLEIHTYMHMYHRSREESVSTWRVVDTTLFCILSCVLVDSHWSMEDLMKKKKICIAIAWLLRSLFEVRRCLVWWRLVLDNLSFECWINRRRRRGVLFTYVSSSSLSKRLHHVSLTYGVLEKPF